MKPPLICTILARAGSKRLANKNLRDLCGKPLVAHTIEQALNSKEFDQILVSSDSPEILEIADKLGVNNLIKRPEELASDTADKMEGIKHAVNEVEAKQGKKFPVIVDLDPTSPLRLVADIKAAINLFFERDAGNLITAMPSRRSPYFNLVELGENEYVTLSKSPPGGKRIFRTQDCPKTYDMNASIYIWKREYIMEEKKGVIFDKTVLYVMPEERSIDIDSAVDFELVKLFMNQRPV